MVRFVAEECEQNPSSARFLDRLPRRFNSHENRIDLRQNMRIAKGQHPASVTHIVIVEDSQALNRLLSPQAFAPYVERDLCIYFPWVSKIVRIKDEGLAFCIENPTKCALVFAVTIPVVDIDNVKISGDHQFSDVSCFRRDLLLLAQRLCLICNLFSKVMKLDFFHR